MDEQMDHPFDAQELEDQGLSIPTLFLNLGDSVAKLLALPELADRWDDKSALDGLTIGAVAAHLGRAFTTTWLYIQADPVDAASAIPAPTYFARVLRGSAEEIAELNATIAQRAGDDAEKGFEGVLDVHRSTLKDLRLQFIGERADRGIEVLDGMIMHLDDYLITRMVEAVVHSDDLCASLGIETPAFETEAVDLVMGAIVGVARERHGDLAILRAFTRGERSTDGLLPVF